MMNSYEYINMAKRLPRNPKNAKHFLPLDLVHKQLRRCVSKDDFDKLYTLLKSATDAIDNKGVSMDQKPMEKKKYHLYITSIDFEYTIHGTQVVLYCRDVNNFEDTYALYTFYHDYFYVKATMGVNRTKEEVSSLLKYVPQKLKNRAIYHRDQLDFTKSIMDVTANRNLTHRYVGVKKLVDCYGYHLGEEDFLMYEMLYPCQTSAFVKIVETSEMEGQLELFETHVDYISKFLANKNLSGFSSFTVSAKPTRSYRTRAKHEIETWVDNIVADNEKPYMEPKVLYFDMECLSSTGEFPDASIDPIIQISVVVAIGSEILFENVLCVGETPGYESYEFEEQVLYRFKQLVDQYDPDIISGFNILGFDLHYFIDRARLLGIEKDVCTLGRRLGMCVKYKKSLKQSNQLGEIESYKYVLHGRTLFDIYAYIQENMDLKEYGLGFIAKKFLKTTKLDYTSESFPECGYDATNQEHVDKHDTYSLMPLLYKFERGRIKIADYCLLDSKLLVELNKALLLTICVIQMTQALGCDLDVTLNRGKVFKIERKLLDYTKKRNYVLPSFTPSQKPLVETYAGAAVLDPVAGFYEFCVSVLDFKSLYPSIMRGWNLSLDTVLLPGADIHMDDDMFESFGNGFRFVKQAVRKGLLSELEEELMDLRDATKAQMKKVDKHSLEYKVLDGKQLAVKIICNSIYGATGAKQARVPLLAIAATICWLGQKQLEATKKFILDNWRSLVGVLDTDIEDIEIVYGDTGKFCM